MRLIDADIVQEQVKIIDKPAWMIVRDAPTIEAEPVRHGEWGIIERNFHNNTVDIMCTECDAAFCLSMFTFGLNYNYCPNCGAKMDGDSHAV